MGLQRSGSTDKFWNYWFHPCENFGGDTTSNEQWLIERHGLRQPGQVRRDLAGFVSAVA